MTELLPTCESTGHASTGWRLPLAVSLIVAAAQFWFVATAATDLPFDDQWDVEGTWMHPAVVDGTFHLRDVFAPHNEHRIAWTHLLNLGLFSINGQWDPLLQVLVIVFLRAATAGALMAGLCRATDKGTQIVAGAVIAVLFLPHLAWFNVLFGFQSQVYFCLGFSVVAIWLLTAPRLGATAWCSGLAVGVLAQLGMGGGAFVAVALPGLLALRLVERPQEWRRWRHLFAGALLLAFVAMLLRTHVPAHDELRAKTVSQFLRTLGLGLAWPYPENPFMAVVANAPFVIWVLRRAGKGEPASHADDFAFTLALFSFAAAVTQAALRGGGPDFAYSVPSRYADFLVPLVVVNFYCLWALLSRTNRYRHKLFAFGAGAWVLVILSGWLGTSLATWQRVIGPRIANLELPTGLVQRYRATGDANVFAGYRRMFVPHPAPALSLGSVLTDPRMKGRLPPSLQPNERMGMWSRGARWLLRHHAAIVFLACAGATALIVRRGRYVDRPKPDSSKVLS